MKNIENKRHIHMPERQEKIQIQNVYAEPRFAHKKSNITKLWRL